jgi:hypothetical protein
MYKSYVCELRNFIKDVLRQTEMLCARYAAGTVLHVSNLYCTTRSYTVRSTDTFLATVQAHLYSACHRISVQHFWNVTHEHKIQDNFILLVS